MESNDQVDAWDPSALSRRQVLGGTAAGFGLFFLAQIGGAQVAIAAQGRPRLLDPHSIPQFASSLLIPPVMPVASRDATVNGVPADYYEISVQEFRQQILPAPLPTTRVWGYGPAKVADAGAPALHNAPSLTIEATVERPVQVKWINGLVDAQGNYRPHLLAVDPSVHWANPPGGKTGRDVHETPAKTPGRYEGPVPMVTHLHGAVDVGDESDGYAESWFLPDAKNIPASFARVGTWYGFFKSKALKKFGAVWDRGSAVATYPNAHRATTSWFHDHALGITRLNVYAGPAGFYLLRGGPAGDASVIDSRTGRPATLPGPAPSAGDPFPADRPYYEIPIAIQDRTFTRDGQLFYPDTREFFDQVAGPYVPETDLPPIWNPEFFGNTIMVNGTTWPALAVEQRRYRLRFLNGCNARFLIPSFLGIKGVRAWQIGNEGGFLEAPVEITALKGASIVMGPAERADVIVDFTDVPLGNHILRNLGPDEPYGGGVPGLDFPAADPRTTGRIMQFHVIPATTPDTSTPAQFLTLPAIAPLTGGSVRRVAIIEEMSKHFEDSPIAGEFGTVDASGTWTQREWGAPVTENPDAGAVELWELYNTTADAHPIHLHAINFQVVDRQPINVSPMDKKVELKGQPRPPRRTERGWKDTVIAYPGEVTRLRMRFGQPGQYTWHCHILEHEDNEMMRPMRVGPEQAGQPVPPKRKPAKGVPQPPHHMM